RGPLRGGAGRTGRCSRLGRRWARGLAGLLHGPVGRLRAGVVEGLGGRFLGGVPERLGGRFLGGVPAWLGGRVTVRCGGLGGSIAHGVSSSRMFPPPTV